MMYGLFIVISLFGNGRAMPDGVNEIQTLPDTPWDSLLYVTYLDKNNHVGGTPAAQVFQLGQQTLATKWARGISQQCQTTSLIFKITHSQVQPQTDTSSTPFPTLTCAGTAADADPVGPNHVESLQSERRGPGPLLHDADGPRLLQ